MRYRSLCIGAALTGALALSACSSATQSAGAPSSTSAPTAALSSSADAGSPTAAALATSSSIASAPAASSAGSDNDGACPSAAPADSFTFASGGDVNIQNLWEKVLLPAFKKACPQFSVNFTFDTHSSNANLDVSKVAAAQKAGKDPGIDVTDDFGDVAAQAGLTEIPTATDIPALSTVDKTALAAYGGGAIPYRGSSVLLAYDSKKVTSPPKTLQALLAWIKAHPGQFTYNTPDSGGSGGSFVETVIDSFVPAADLAKMQTGYVPALESDWKQGLQVLKDLTPSIYQNVYPHGNQAVLDLLGKGEISMAPVWSDQFLSALSLKELGSQFKVAQISNPSFNGGAAYIAIIKNSPHRKAAEAFIQWLLQPTQQADIVTQIAGFPAIPLTALPASAQGAFAGVNTQALRPDISSKMGADLSDQWASTVTS